MADTAHAPPPPSAPTGSAPTPGAAQGHAPHPDTRLATAKNNIKYLALGNKAGVKPGSVATRSLLTTARYLLRYVIHRMLRVAKYAAIGAGIAFVGTGVLGAVGTGVAWFLVPSTGMGITFGVMWGLAKFGWRHRPERFRGGWWSEMADRAAAGRDAATDEADDAGIAEAAEAERHRRMNRMGGDIWVPA